MNIPFRQRGVCQYYYCLVCLFLELSSIRYQLQHFCLHPWYYLLLSVVGTREAGWTSFCSVIQYYFTVQCDWACRQNSEVSELWKTWNVTHGLNWWTCIWNTVKHLQVVVLRRGFTGIDIQTVGVLIIRHFFQPIGDSFVRTCRGTVLQYVENKVPLALKRSVAAHRFLNKICFNGGYLSGPKVCRSNLETSCIYIYMFIKLEK